MQHRSKRGRNALALVVLLSASITGAQSDSLHACRCVAPPPPPLEDWFEHVDYIARLVGKENVGLGSDFDGIGAWPGELKDITSIDIVTAGLLERGWSEKELVGFYSGNLLRAWEKVEEVAGR